MAVDQSPRKYGAGIELATPGSTVRLASVAKHVTDCATRPGTFWIPNRPKLFANDICKGYQLTTKVDASQESLMGNFAADGILNCFFFCW